MNATINYPYTHFHAAFDASIVDKFLLTYVQNEIVILEKTEADVMVEGNVWSVELTQEETKKFKAGVAACQIRILTTDGKALASDPFQFGVTQVFNDEVIFE